MQKVKCKNAGYSWARLIINIINLLVVITLLTIILYVAFNYKKILTNAIQGGLDTVNDKRSNIQGSINKFATTTVKNVLQNPKINNEIDKLVNNATVPVINTLQKNMAKAFKKPPFPQISESENVIPSKDLPNPAYKK